MKPKMIDGLALAVFLLGVACAATGWVQLDHIDGELGRRMAEIRSQLFWRHPFQKLFYAALMVVGSYVAVAVAAVSRERWKRRKRDG